MTLWSASVGSPGISGGLSSPHAGIGHSRTVPTMSTIDTINRIIFIQDSVLHGRNLPENYQRILNDILTREEDEE